MPLRVGFPKACHRDWAGSFSLVDGFRWRGCIGSDFFNRKYSSRNFRRDQLCQVNVAKSGKYQTCMPNAVIHLSLGSAFCPVRRISLDVPKQAIKPLPPPLDPQDVDHYMTKRKFADISPEKFFDALAPESDPNHEQTRKKIAMVIEEYEHAKYATLRVPSNLTVHNMEILLQQWHHGHIERIRYFEALYLVERKLISRQIRKDEEQKVVGELKSKDILVRA